MKKSSASIAALIGIFGLARMLTSSRLETIRTVDVVQLIGIGMCFGVALAGLLTLAQTRKDAPR